MINNCVYFTKDIIMWYVYILHDPRNNTPFYVGKGSKRRLKVTMKSGNPLKNKFLKEIKLAGMSPVIEVDSEHEFEDSALLREKTLIEQYGRIIKGTGTLTNYADGGEHGNTGYIHTEKTKQLWSAQRKGVIQAENHVEARRVQLVGKQRSVESKRKYTLASIRRTNVDLKVKIIEELEQVSYTHGLYVTLSKKFGCDQELISRIHKDINLYKEALDEWIKK
jgi:hypothetical protein